ncbi:serine/threonine protein kinase [Thermoproteota archaeon]
MSILLDIPTEIICYPKPNEQEKARRIKELQSIGVKNIRLEGPKKIDGHQVIGKGCVSIAVLADTASRLAILKIRRMDADRLDMLHEVQMLKFANTSSLGPRLFHYSKNFIIMEYIAGSLIGEWLNNVRSFHLTKVKAVIKDILTQCYKMDIIHLDHGELSNASKHVIIRNSDWKSIIIDFESASRNRRPNNLTSIFQFIFKKKELLDMMQISTELFTSNDSNKILKNYKNNPSKRTLNQILQTYKLN